MTVRNVSDFCEFVNRTTTRPRLLLGDIYAVGSSRLPVPGNPEGRLSALDVAYTGWRIPEAHLRVHLAAWERLACAVEGRRCSACEIYPEVDAEAGRYGFACEFTQEKLSRLRAACCCRYLQAPADASPNADDIPF